MSVFKMPFLKFIFFFEILCFKNSFFSLRFCALKIHFFLLNCVFFSKHIQRTFKNVWSLNLKLQKWLLGVDVWSFYHFLNLPLTYILIHFSTVSTFRGGLKMSGGELLELRLLDTHLLDTFGSKSIARHKFYHLLESS